MGDFEPWTFDTVGFDMKPSSRKRETIPLQANARRNSAAGDEASHHATQLTGLQPDENNSPDDSALIRPVKG